MFVVVSGLQTEGRVWQKLVAHPKMVEECNKQCVRFFFVQPEVVSTCNVIERIFVNFFAAGYQEWRFGICFWIFELLEQF